MAGDVPPPVRRALDAVEHGDTSAFVEAFAPDGLVDDNGREFRGREAIALWSEAEFIGLGGRMDLRASRPTQQGVSLDVMFTSRGFNGFSRFDFDVADDAVTALRIAA